MHYPNTDHPTFIVGQMLGDPEPYVVNARDQHGDFYPVWKGDARSQWDAAYSACDASGRCRLQTVNMLRGTVTTMEVGLAVQIVS